MVGVLLVAAPARAHDYLVGSIPEQGATLDSAPEQVALEFNTSIGERFAQVAVMGSDGTAFAAGDPVVDGAVVTQAVQDIPAGTGVTISYRVVSSDGHPIGGTVAFAVAGTDGAPAQDGNDASGGDSSAGDASASATDTSAADVDRTAATETGDSRPLLPWLGLLFVAAATVAGLATFVVTRRRRQQVAVTGGTPPIDESR
jgi:methionine-rich copper-binding protein CopC